MPPLEPRLKLTIISGHFNDWRTKITNETERTSYLRHPDEDFFNWDVLRRFTHLELTAAMYPRPVMVEFAERDGTLWKADVVELFIDADRNGRVDTWTSMDGTRPLSSSIDRNEDGKIDRFGLPDDLRIESGKDTWLKIQRKGNQFYGYATQEAGKWHALENKTIELPAGMGKHFFFGLGNGDCLAFFWFPGAPGPGFARSPPALRAQWADRRPSRPSAHRPGRD